MLKQITNYKEKYDNTRKLQYAITGDQVPSMSRLTRNRGSEIAHGRNQSESSLVVGNLLVTKKTTISAEPGFEHIKRNSLKPFDSRMGT